MLRTLSLQFVSLFRVISGTGFVRGGGRGVVAYGYACEDATGEDADGGGGVFIVVGTPLDRRFY